MEQNGIIELVDAAGNVTEVEAVTYLVSNDKSQRYVVYTKGEVRGENNNHVIYISRIYKDGDTLKIDEITSDEEWKNVQVLLKQIANSD